MITKLLFNIVSNLIYFMLNSKNTKPLKIIYVLYWLLILFFFISINRRTFLHFHIEFWFTDLIKAQEYNPSEQIYIIKIDWLIDFQELVLWPEQWKIIFLNHHQTKGKNCMLARALCCLSCTKHGEKMSKKQVVAYYSLSCLRGEIIVPQRPLCLPVPLQVGCRCFSCLYYSARNTPKVVYSECCE